MPDPTNTIEFWTVWNPQGRVPSIRHRSVELADTEAMRLANLHPGQSFYVMKAVSVARGVETRTVNVTSVSTHPADNRTEWKKGLDAGVVRFTTSTSGGYTAHRNLRGSWTVSRDRSSESADWSDAEVRRNFANGYWKLVK